MPGLGEMHLEIYSQAGRRIARHRRAPNGAGQIVRSPEHAKLLEQAVLGLFTSRKLARHVRRALARVRPALTV